MQKARFLQDSKKNYFVYLQHHTDLMELFVIWVKGLFFKEKFMPKINILTLFTKITGL